jgi:hypothetical protein
MTIPKKNSAVIYLRRSSPQQEGESFPMQLAAIVAECRERGLQVTVSTTLVPTMQVNVVRLVYELIGVGMSIDAVSQCLNRINNANPQEE